MPLRNISYQMVKSPYLENGLIFIYPYGGHCGCPHPFSLPLPFRPAWLPSAPAFLCPRAVCGCQSLFCLPWWLKKYVHRYFDTPPASPLEYEPGFMTWLASVKWNVVETIVWLSRLGHKRHCGLAVSQITRLWGEPYALSWGNWKVRWRGLHGEKLRLLATSQHSLASHVREPSQKKIVQHPFGLQITKVLPVLTCRLMQNRKPEPMS